MDSDQDGAVTLPEWLSWITAHYNQKESKKVIPLNPIETPLDTLDTQQQQQHHHEEEDVALPTSHLLARLRAIRDLAAQHIINYHIWTYRDLAAQHSHTTGTSGIGGGGAGGDGLGWRSERLDVPDDAIPALSAWVYLAGRSEEALRELTGEEFLQEVPSPLCVPVTTFACRSHAHLPSPWLVRLTTLP
jgi:hypothetical protein